MKATHSDISYVVFFDGVCNLCNSSVQRIIKNDPKGKFKFAALQSNYACATLGSDSHHIKNLESIVLITPSGKCYSKTRAVLRIAVQLKFPYPLFGLLFIFPYFLRDVFYQWISINRYKIFGKQESCMIPTPEIKSRFLE